MEYGSASLAIKQDCCGVVAQYDRRTCEVCAVYQHEQNGFTHFATFISKGHMRDFEGVNSALTRVWCSDDG